jgi:hypothetical protein
MAYQKPVTIETRTITSGAIHIEYPKISGLGSPQVTEQINRAITRLVQEMYEQQKHFQTGTLAEMIGHYEIKTNERGILSLLLSNYAYSSPMAHGYTIAKSLTFDVNTGKSYQLADLFKPGSNYVEAISRIIAIQIQQRSLPLLNGFQQIEPNQDFYLADKSLVIYFQLYEITPYYVGFPMFPISNYDLLSIAADKGPIDILSADIN